MLTHSLVAAVVDQTITAESAFCGLGAFDIEALLQRHPEAWVLVRFRSEKGDWRQVLRVRDLPREGSLEWFTIRDVFAVPKNEIPTERMMES